VRGFLQDTDKVCPQCGSGEVAQRFTGFGGVTGLKDFPSCADGGGCSPHSCAQSGCCMAH